MPPLPPGVTLSLEVSALSGPTLREFKAKLKEDETVRAKIQALRAEVEAFAMKFPLPGHAEL